MFTGKFNFIISRLIIDQDSFELEYNLDFEKITVPWTYKGLIWDVDRKVKYRNPPVPKGKTLCDIFKVV